MYREKEDTAVSLIMLMVDGECLSSEDSLRADHHIHLRLRSGIELIPTSTVDHTAVKPCHRNILVTKHSETLVLVCIVASLFFVDPYMTV